MSDEARLLRPEDESEIESYLDETRGRFHSMLECIGRIISEGISEGRFTERQAQHDMDIALWVAYACNNINDYEHYCTSCEWLSRVEDRASGCGTWFYRYSNALLFTGKPRLAMEYASRGVEEEPSYPWCWLTLGRLRAHYGDREGALAAAERGLELVPGDREFEVLKREIERGCGIEQMELHFIDEAEDVPEGMTLEEAFESDDEQVSSLAEAVMGIVTYPEGLEAVKSALRPEGWIADHPYCTYMMSRGGGQILVTLAMNEAFLSKVPPERITAILDGLDGLEARGRESLGARAEGKALYGVTIDRRMRPMLSFGGFADEEPVTVAFDEDLEPLKDTARGGPFVSIVLLEDDSWDPEALKRELVSRWGIRVAETAENDNLVFEVEGNLGMFSLIHTPVPGGEAEETAANNYMWPEARETAARHRAHMLVALINHRTPAVRAAIIHTKMVDAACRQPGAIGVYFQNTVVSPEAYREEAERIRDGEIPVRDLVWIGMYRTELGVNAYTRGMNLFCRDEMEIVGADAPPDRIHALLCDVVDSLLENDVELEDGDTISYNGEEALRIERSPGVSVDGMTLKIKHDREIPL